MLNKRGIELSLNFLVILIISIIIFGFGVRFIYKLYSSATDLQELSMSQLDKKIGDIVCEGSDRVCIGIDKKTIKRTKFDVFGIKIINILDDEKNFIVKVSTPKDGTVVFLGYTRDNKKIPITSEFPGLKVNPQQRPVKIEKNEVRAVGIQITVPAKAISGTYIFNVDITYKDLTADEKYGSTQKLYVDVP